jgi:hypothetical protein
MKKLFQIADNPVLEWLIFHLILYRGLMHNRGKFKPGEKVCYNFFARVCIDSAINWKRSNNIDGDVFTVSHYSEWAPRQDHINFTNGDSCDTAWLRRLTKKELQKYGN